MSLSLECRPCGKVYVIRCVGRIVTGEETTTLQAAFNRASLEFRQVVLDVAEVARLDSTGMGLLVRFLSHTRNRSGDLRLAAPQPFVRSLLDATKLSTVFRVYESDEEAILSFVKNPSPANATTKSSGPVVLFIDQSPDLCAFVRTFLDRNGYDVLSTCRIREARTLLSASNIDYIVLGPDSSQLPSDNVIDSLKLLAPKATIMQLESGFELGDPERAGADLLRRLQSSATSA
jgi:anti-sigma B factor antagonist